MIFVIIFIKETTRSNGTRCSTISSDSESLTNSESSIVNYETNVRFISIMNSKF